MKAIICLGFIFLTCVLCQEPMLISVTNHQDNNNLEHETLDQFGGWVTVEGSEELVDEVFHANVLPTGNEFYEEVSETIRNVVEPVAEGLPTVFDNKLPLLNEEGGSPILKSEKKPKSLLRKQEPVGQRTQGTIKEALEKRTAKQESRGKLGEKIAALEIGQGVRSVDGLDLGEGVSKLSESMENRVGNLRGSKSSEGFQLGKREKVLSLNGGNNKIVDPILPLKERRLNDVPELYNSDVENIVRSSLNSAAGILSQMAKESDSSNSKFHTDLTTVMEEAQETLSNHSAGTAVGTEDAAKAASSTISAISHLVEEEVAKRMSGSSNTENMIIEEIKTTISSTPTIDEIEAATTGGNKISLSEELDYLLALPTNEDEGSSVYEISESSEEFIKPLDEYKKAFEQLIADCKLDVLEGCENILDRKFDGPDAEFPELPTLEELEEIIPKVDQIKDISGKQTSENIQKLFKTAGKDFDEVVPKEINDWSDNIEKIAKQIPDEVKITTSTPTLKNLFKRK